VAYTQGYLNEERLANFVDKHGTIMKYYQATMCPCLVEGKGQPDPACDCSGGFRYDENPVEYKVLRTSVSMRGLHADIARVLQGGCQITVPNIVPVYGDDGTLSGYEDCQLWDRVAIGDVFSELNRERRDRDILIKGTRDTLRSFDVHEIISVKTATHVYLEQEHYTLPSDKSEIVWKPGEGPSNGDAYTVEFLSKVQFIVWDDMAKHRGSEVETLPHRLLCRLRQYVDWSSSPIDNLEILPEHVS
jgi:hypothetical protein